MSRHATDWAWETDPGSSSLKLILLSMADRADEYNLCYPSIERLVKDTCLNKKNRAGRAYITHENGAYFRYRREKGSDEKSAGFLS